MKKVTSLLAILFLLVVVIFEPISCQSTADPEKIDPTLRFLMAANQRYSHSSTKDSLAQLFGVNISSSTTQVAITFKDESVNVATFEAETGIRFCRIDNRIVHTKNIYQVEVPWTEIDHLVWRNDILRVESAHKFGIEPLDVSVPEIKADLAWMVKDYIGRSVTGNGTIIADLDTGVDWEHPQFFYENGTGKVLKILDDFDGDTNPDEHVRGVDLDTAAPDANGHGTSVCSILAGGNIGIDNYVGVAPGSGVIVGRIFSPNNVPIITAAQWAYDSGANVILYEVGGWVFNYLDGSTAEEAQIDDLVAQGTTVVIPAGNLAGSNKHARTLLPSGSGSMKFNVPSSITHILMSIVWRTTTKNLAVKMTNPRGTETSLPGDGTWITMDDHSIWSYKSISPRSTARFDIELSKDTVDVGGWTLTIDNPSTTAEEVNCYIADDKSGWSGGATFIDFTDDSRTVTWPSTADSAISVASYATRARYTGIVGDISFFSGRGPRIDGFQKPDISAPGHYDIWAATSQHAGYPPGSFDWFSGTSAAGPHVAGTAALIIQANPSMASSVVRDIIRNTAKIDSFVQKKGVTPNSVWGWGKVDTLSSVTISKFLLYPVSIASNSFSALVPSTSAAVFSSPASASILSTEGAIFESQSVSTEIIQSNAIISSQSFQTSILTHEPARIISNTVKIEVLKTIFIYTDKYTYATSDTMHVGLNVTNPGSKTTVCVVVWLERPTGPIYVLLHAHAITLPANFSYGNPDQWIFKLPSISPGVYTWHAAVVDPATHAIMSEDTTEWEFS